MVVLCIFSDRGRILVGRGYDDVKGEAFLRPVGGAVEFGETAVEALRREIREELGVEISSPLRVGVLENLFTYRGDPGHEIVLIYDARLAEPHLYEQPLVPLREEHWEGAARWLALNEPLPAPLYPDGLTDLLRE